MKKFRRVLGFCLVALGMASAQDAGLHMIQTYKIGGEGGWDYLNMDANSRRLFISRGTHVIVLDADTGKPVGDILDTPGVHGIALAPDLGRGFTSNGREGTVTIFDLTTLKPIAKVKNVGKNPDAILFDPSTKRVFTFNGGSHDATAIEAATGTIVGTIPLGGKPEFGVSTGAGEVFVNIEDKNEIVKLSATDLKVLDTWSLAGCESPSGMAIDRSGHRLFSVCDGGKMAVTNYDTGKVIALASIGQGPDAAFYDPQRKLAFSSNGGDGTLTVVDASKTSFPTVQSVQTAKRARTMAYNVARGEAYLCTATFEAAAGGGRPATVPDSFEVLVVSK